MMKLMGRSPTDSRTVIKKDLPTLFSNFKSNNNYNSKLITSLTNIILKMEKLQNILKQNSQQRTIADFYEIQRLLQSLKSHKDLNLKTMSIL